MSLRLFPTGQHERQPRMWLVTPTKDLETCVKNTQMYYCAFIGAFGENACNPRTLGSSHLNRMVSLEGIVTKCSLVRPKVIQSVHFSEKKNKFFTRKYRDQTMTASGATSLNVYPQEDDEKNPVRKPHISLLDILPC